MKLFNEIVERKASISLVGLGYVEMPIAVAFAEKANVIGFDISKAKEMLGYDPSWSFERGIEAAIEWYKENL